ncbi:MAG: HAD family phosphatase [Reyranella sp.]|uniref:Cof-type HAD-IIB family hydrolase n=1 Tax=Reyranella sp. TaxID=1929291 RepID=UPI001AD28D53|nr:Cof-type HAD-IIB family hydrolase [Reyranella sp.]MBN9090842.1 HAD family phosphatase [Reyranella sp.]
MKISALISDVDGTLVTPAKILTERSQQAVAELHRRGIGFTIISARPPRAMTMFVEPLSIAMPIAGFNGGAFTGPDLTPIENHLLAPETAQRAHDLLRSKGIDVWVFSGLDWLLIDADNAHVVPEIRVVRFKPTLVRNLEPALASAFKVVGVSEDHDLLARCERELQAALGEQASVSRSQPFYLDVTHPLANKGTAVARLAALMGVPLAEVAVIGDNHNDVGMFAQGGLSIAMGNAVPDVQAHAAVVTESNDREGFAEAIRKYILDA